MIKVTCSNCGKEKKIYPYELKKSSKFFCSYKCRGEYRTRNRAVIRQCWECGREIKVAKSRLKAGRGVYCSKECCLKNTKANLKPQKKLGKYIKCEVCQKSFYVKRVHLKKTKYCSKECSLKVTKLRGHEGIETRFKKGTGYKGGKWAGRLYAVERDHYRCVFCGYDKFIEVHHIISPKQGGLNKLDNLITLCPNHHTEVQKGSLSISYLKAFVKKLSSDFKEKITSKQRWSRREITQTIRRLFFEGDDISEEKVKIKYPKLFKVALLCNGSWQEVLDRANLNTTRLRG